jgi:hypothetical protein
MMNCTDLSAEEVSLTLSHYATAENSTRHEEMSARFKIHNAKKLLVVSALSHVKQG